MAQAFLPIFLKFVHRYLNMVEDPKVTEPMSAEQLIPLLEPGDLIVVDHKKYQQWLCFIGGDDATATYMDKDKGYVEAPLVEIVGEKLCFVNNKMDAECTPFDGTTIVKRARERVGENYNLVQCNCEQISNWARYARHYSSQVVRRLNNPVLKLFIRAEKLIREWVIIGLFFLIVVMPLLFLRLIGIDMMDG